MLAGCSMGVFKTHYLGRNTLALTHNKAYIDQNKSYSSGSIEWLEYVKKTRNVDVHHTVNHGEVSIGKYFLDGYYQQDGVRHGLEYAGCIFHGHCCRFEPHESHPLSNLILFSLTDAKENSCFHYAKHALTIKTRPRAVPTRMRKDHSPAPGYPLSF